MQSYSKFQRIFKYFQTATNNSRIIAWRSKFFQKILLSLLLHQIIVFLQEWLLGEPNKVKCDVSYLKQEKTTFNHKSMINLSTVYEINWF